MRFKITNYIIPLILIIYSLILSLQGLDFGDAGWQLTGYDNIIKYPQGVHYSFMFWLSNILGNIWHSILPGFGLYWSRIGVIILLIASLLHYTMVLHQFSSSFNWTLPLGLMYLHSFGGAPEAVNYDIFTIFFLSLAVLFLYKGLLKKNVLFILLFGFFIGINLFLKLSNAASFVLIFVILFYAFLEKWKFKLWFKFFIISIIGYCLAVFVVIGIMKYIGHWELFLENIKFVSNMASADEASHGFSNLLISYISGYGKIAVLSLFPIIALIAYKYIAKLVVINKYVQYTLLALLIIAFTFISFKFGNPVWSKIRYAFYGLIIFSSILLILSKQTSNNRKTLLLTGLLLVLIAPLGSDSGLEKIILGVWLLGAIFIFYLKNGFNILIKKLKFEFSLSPILYNTFLIILFVTYTSYAWNNTYNDPGNRFSKTYSINHEKLKYIYTTKERADAVNELLKTINKFVKPNDYLLAFNEIPMLHYLTDTKPFISTSWPKLIYSNDIFEKELNNSVNTKGLAIIVRQKMNMGLSNWPQNTIDNYTDYKDDGIKYREQGVVLNRFIKKYKYQKVWENKAFEILKADE